jgi:hypothetical protein
MSTAFSRRSHILSSLRVFSLSVQTGNVVWGSQLFPLQTHYSMAFDGKWRRSSFRNCNVMWDLLQDSGIQASCRNACNSDFTKNPGTQ